MKKKNVLKKTQRQMNSVINSRWGRHCFRFPHGSFLGNLLFLEPFKTENWESLHARNRPFFLSQGACTCYPPAKKRPRKRVSLTRKLTNFSWLVCSDACIRKAASNYLLLYTLGHTWWRFLCPNVKILCKSKKSVSCKLETSGGKTQTDRHTLSS